MAKIKDSKIKKTNNIYLPVSSERYKKNKILMLKIMLSLIECTKRIEKVRNLKKEKALLIEELRKLLKDSHHETNNLNEDLPIVDNKIETKRIRIVKKINIEKELSIENGIGTKIVKNKKIEKLSGLDKELEEIKLSLARLNEEEI
ncbi:MAG: hypothetical protein QW103_01820 [Candidatus Pacearchaeota archaeon]